MKLYVTLLLLQIAQLAAAQADSLLKLSFNDRYPILEKLVKKQAKQTDSLVLFPRLDSLLEFAQKSGNRQFNLELKSIRLNQQIEWSSADNYDKITAAYTELIEAAKKIKHAPLVANLEFDLAEFNWIRVENFNIAMAHYDIAYQMAKELRDEDYYNKQRNIYKLGEKYYFLTDYSNAIVYIKEAEQVNNPWDPLHPKISIFNTMGLAYRIQENLDKAEECFQKGLEYAKKANAKAWIGNLSGNLGSIYLMKGAFEKGAHLLRTDKDISLARGAKNSASGALLALAELNADKGNIALATQQLDSALLLMKNNVPIHRKKAVYQTLSKINGYKGLWKVAANYLDSAIIVRDTLAKKDNTLQMLRLKQRVELEASKAAISKAEAVDRRKTLQLYGMIAGLFLAIGIGLYILRQKRKTDVARKRSDELLLNILPFNVAEELKATGRSKARRFSNVSVLFSDFKGFTRYSEQMPPEALVKILDDYFKVFDQIVTECGLEKIKTIGDAYMCVCGLPTEDPKHAEKTVEAALKIQDFMKESSAGWELRIGIHSGSVVAGIVGITKFAYDIWGDTVNTAARLEQHSEPGKINVSQATFELVNHAFKCQYRGKLEAKNKGALDMYFVEKAH